MIAAPARSITRVIGRWLQAVRACAATRHASAVPVDVSPAVPPVASATPALYIPIYIPTAAACEAAATVLASGCAVLLVETPGFRPAYCILDQGQDFQSAIPV